MHCHFVIHTAAVTVTDIQERSYVNLATIQSVRRKTQEEEKGGGDIEEANRKTEDTVYVETSIRKKMSEIVGGQKEGRCYRRRKMRKRCKRKKVQGSALNLLFLLFVAFNHPSLQVAYEDSSGANEWHPFSGNEAKTLKWSRGRV